MSPTTVTDACLQEDEHGATSAPPAAPRVLTAGEKAHTFDLKEKHYLSLIFRLRSELAKIKKDKGESMHIVERGVETINKKIPLISNFVRKTSKPFQR